jgi:DNA-binding NarL/FixJ family response regulator
LRIVIGEMPQLLQDIVEHIVRSRPDLEIVRQWNGGIARALEHQQADLVIVQVSSNGASGHESQRWPEWGAQDLVLVTYTDRDGGAFTFRPLAVQDLSPDALVQAIRTLLADRERCRERRADA